ncbi:MAG: molybdenum cofactor biosynthesis protein MoaE [Acidobacteria bacterium]|nr:molybdenum cofactor biosynthesis protein MoaE [Acidobacteriota bacterium]
MAPETTGDTAESITRCELVDHAIDLGELYSWAIRPECGAVVVFSGITRDHSGDRADVSVLEYEAYTELVIERFEQIVEQARASWPEIVRVGIVHRLGEVAVGESSVVVVVSSPHRGDAFDAGRNCIDVLKDTAPIWKREVWAEGESWGLDARSIEEVDTAPLRPAETAR